MMRRLLLPLAALLAAPALAQYDPGARVFDKAWDTVEAHYWNRALTGNRWLALRERYRDRIVAAPDRRQFYTLLGEMLAQLGDSHVFAIDPLQVRIGRDQDKARSKGHDLAGFGFDMLPDDDGTWRVTAVRSGGPAARAGVQIGWAVQAIDGEAVDIDYRPEPDRPVAMRFVDEAKRVHGVTLAAVPEQALPVRRATTLPGGVLLIGLDGFDPGADRWLAGAIAEASTRAVILDLRGNDGGDADVIAKVGGLFFARNRVLVRQIGRREKDQMTQGAGPRSWLGPLAVLIGPNSASGAEALAALIDEAGRGVTVGERTAGALTGASLYRLPDGGQLSVAEFDIRTAGGKRLEGVGLAPRVSVVTTLAQRRAGQDAVLERARRLVTAEVAER